MERMPKPIAYLEGDHWFSWDRTGRSQYVAAIKFSNGMIFDNIRGWMPGSDYSPAESVHTTISLARFNILDYTLRDVKDAKRRIMAECPGWRVEDWQDYGFKLTAFKEPNGPAFIIYQPYRSDNGQEKIMPESHDKMVEMLNAA